MDPKNTGLSDYSTGSIIDEQTILPSYDQYPDTENGLKLYSPSFDLNIMNVPLDPPPDSSLNDLGIYFTLSPRGESIIPGFSPGGESFEPSSGWSLEEGGSSPSEDRESTDPVLKYITQMLLEENMEDKPPMLYDAIALKAAEKSLYDVLGENDRPYINHESPDSCHSGNSSDYGGNTNTCTSTGTSSSSGTTSSTNDFVDPPSVFDVQKSDQVSLQTSVANEYSFMANSIPGVQVSADPLNDLPNAGNGIIGPSVSEMAQNLFSDSDSVSQFKKGLEEASKFLPKASQLVIDLEGNLFSNGQKESARLSVRNEEKVERESSNKGSSRGKKHQIREASDLEPERSSKQLASYVEESEFSEAFDKVLLWPGLKGAQWSCFHEVKQDGKSKVAQPFGQSNGSNDGKARAKKQVKRKETVDLRSLLILCAQAVSGNDVRTANELLKQIRQHSSPLGDGSQRLAHCFANGLEARLAGVGTTVQNFYTSRRMTTADVLKAYKTHLYACPFKKLSIVFANKMILHAAEQATTLHIVDFGVLYGFQWPLLIQLLSMREGGPPKLRITGIELPQQGFRPAERIEETGRRLERYCKMFDVPFEYNPIAAQHWENIPVEALKIKSNEVLAVNSFARFKNLLDETVEVDCPRNAVLELIRKINPNIFVQTIINGSYNSPFFVTRFREALFHYSSMFDMFDSTLPREDHERLMLENDMYGREAVNAVACEGAERVERPETYKQWQLRLTRAGFKQLPLNQDVMETCRHKLKKFYHKDFVMDEDNNWMLQGWKGRIAYASTCWAPA